MKLEVEIEEGDILKFNDKEWEVSDIWMGTIDLDPVVGEYRAFNREELESLIEYSGEFTRIKEDYVDVIDY